MVIKEWGEIRQLYNTSRPTLKWHRTTHPAWVYWGIRTLFWFLIILLLLALIDVPRDFGLPDLIHVFGLPDFIGLLSFQQGLFILGALLLWAYLRLAEKALANEFTMLYSTYGLTHYPWWRRRLYLHYALFLRALTERASPVSRETITQLRSFADIARQPPLPESRLLQAAFIVPYIVFLNLLLLEILKKTDLLEGRRGMVIIIVSVIVLFMLYTVLQALHGVATVGQLEDRTLQRFLQWAEMDIEEAQRLRRQRLHREAPGAHGR